MKRTNEGLGAARFVMVLASISPLFVFWALRGSVLIPDAYFVTGCVLMVVVPNMFLLLRIHGAKKLKEIRQIEIGTAEDHRDHLLVYLFAMLLPFYAADFETWRDFSANLVALSFIVFLFWHLNLHYMNISFAAFGYRVFTIHPPKTRNQLSGKASMVLISSRDNVSESDKIKTYRLSNTVYFEAKDLK